MTGTDGVRALAFTEVDGVVVSFDERRGLGEVVTAGGQRVRFHATQIADGTRRVGPRTAVRFVVRPGPAGTWEAARLVTRSSA